MTKAHRLILEIKLGRPIRPGYHALHTCDYTPCVHANHIIDGTHKENTEHRAQRNPEVIIILEVKSTM
jgi:hypothetical protein